MQTYLGESHELATMQWKSHLKVSIVITSWQDNMQARCKLEQPAQQHIFQQVCHTRQLFPAVMYLMIVYHRPTRFTTRLYREDMQVAVYYRWLIVAIWISLPVTVYGHFKSFTTSSTRDMEQQDQQDRITARLPYTTTELPELHYQLTKQT